MLESRSEDALVKLVESVEIVESVETVETLEIVEYIPDICHFFSTGTYFSSIFLHAKMCKSR